MDVFRSNPRTSGAAGRGLLIFLAILALLLIFPRVAPGATPVANPDGALPCEIAKILASDGAGGDRFGTAIALDGDTALVGAPQHNNYTGAAYIFVRSGTSWSLQTKLTADDGWPQDNFGISVALSGDTAIVGAHGDSAGIGYGVGCAYIFTRSGTTWSKQATLAAVDGAPAAYFGYAVGLSGDTALVGAYGDNGARGSAYVFTRSGTTWSQESKLGSADGTAGDHFGWAVTLSGETALVGARGANASQGSAYVFTRSGTTWSQQSKLTASDGAAGDHFGWAVALSGETALVGAATDSIGANASQGSAYVFTRSGTTWSQQSKLTASDGAAGDQFGWAVALSGGAALVGAPYDSVANTAQGSAYTFTGSGTAWEQTRLTAANGEASDNFGASVAMSGDVTLVGADGAGGVLYARGAAYVFSPYVTPEGSAFSLAAPGVLANDTDDDGHTLTAELVSAPAHGTVVLASNGGFLYTPAARYRGGIDTFTYRAVDSRGAASAPALVTIRVDAAPVANPDGVLPAQVAQLLAEDGAAGDLFGNAVAVSGDTMIVGARGDGSDQGSVYVFVRARAGWVLQRKLTADGGAANDAFGSAVAISGDTIVVGACSDDVRACSDDLYQSSAYVFSRSGTTWTQQAKLTVPDGAPDEGFGSTVAISGDTIAVGTPGDDLGANQDQGSAYVFVRSGAAWSQQEKLVASDGAELDWFGESVALSGDTIAVGAPGDDLGANQDQGSAHVFVRSGTAWSQQEKLAAPDGAAFDLFGESVAISGDTIAVGTPGDDLGANQDQGSAHVFVRSGTAWSQQEKLAAPDGAELDRFGESVALSGDMVLLGAPYADGGVRVDRGSAYVFVRSGTTWTQQEKLAAPDGAGGDLFGESVALSGRTALVGSFLDDVGTNLAQGSAYAYAPYETPVNSVLTVLSPGVLANDTDAEGAALTAELVTPPAHGTVTLVPSGRFHYTPAAGFTGSDAFTYRANDGLQYSGPAEVTVAVRPANTPPVANPDGLLTQVAHLLGPLGPSTEFSSAIAVSGDTMVQGCGDERVGGNGYQGAVHVYVRAGTTWAEQATLTAADGEALDCFGTSVAISGDTVVVGAPYDDVSGNTNQGSVRVYTRSGGVWSPQQTLTLADGEVNDGFGVSVAVAGETLVASVLYDTVGANAYQGSARVFSRSAGVWSPEATLVAPEGRANEFFGSSVAIWGETVVVGDGAASVRGNRAQGSAFVFVRGGGAWPPQAYLTVADGAAEDAFGCAVAVCGDTLLVGARGRNGGTGAAFVYTRSDVGTWSEQQELLADDGAARDNFGGSVALWGDTAVVGAMLDDVGSNLDQGSVRIFVRAEGLWLPQPMLTGTGTGINDFFGASVGIDSGTIVVGAYHWDQAANTGQHSASVFEPGYVTYEDTPLHIPVPGLLANDSDADNDALAAFTASASAHGSVSVTAEGSFVYVPEAGFTGDDAFTYRAWDGRAYSAPALAAIRVIPGGEPAATTLSLKGPGSPPAYNTATTLRATLATASGPAGAGHTIVFQRYTGGKWVTLGSAVSDAAGVARHSSRALSTSTRFRARFAGDADCAPSDSAELTVVPKAWLSTPAAPATAYRNKAFVTVGYLKPRHAAGSYPVRLQCFRYQKQAGVYKWVLRKTVSAKAANYSTYTRHSAKVALAYSGKWRIRARHLDASHALTYSGWRYVTVK